MAKLDNFEAWISLPRGIRNNNPGNIRRVKGQTWQGELTKEQVIQRGWKWDEAFVQFDDMVYGLRAMWKTLDTYQTKHKCKTVEQIITRWAPPADKNNTAGYIKFVCDKTTLYGTYKLSDFRVFYDMFNMLMIQAMCLRECNYEPSCNHLKLAWYLAFKPREVDRLIRDEDGEIRAYTQRIEL